MNYNQAKLKSEIISSLAHPVRLILVDALSSQSVGFRQLCLLFDLDKSTISKHLSILKQNGIVSVKKEGTESIYSLEIPCFKNFLDCVDSIIKENMKKQQCCIS